MKIALANKNHAKAAALEIKKLEVLLAQVRDPGKEEDGEEVPDKEDIKLVTYNNIWSGIAVLGIDIYLLRTALEYLRIRQYVWTLDISIIYIIYIYLQNQHYSIIILMWPPQNNTSSQGPGV